MLRGMRSPVLLVALAAACGGTSAGPTDAGPAGPDAGPAGPDAGPPWLQAPAILVPGVGVANMECRDAVCPHNENTDLFVFHGAIYLVHRTALSQILGPNSSLRVYKSTDGGGNFNLLAVLPAPDGRDLRDPCFYVAGGKLAMKAVTRLPVVSARDSGVDTITVGTISDEGTSWSPFAPLAPETWTFWRVREHAGVLYAAAYEDGDKSIKLFTSQDGMAWSAGPVIYDNAADTVLEAEIVFMPSGRMLVFFREDGTAAELYGNVGRLRTRVCWAEAPYTTFSCPQELSPYRLDGPVAFFHGSRLFVLARKHFIEPEDRKRTALYELGGNLEGGPLTITELGTVPSAGDTAYGGFADTDADHGVITWYSSDIAVDDPWSRALLDAADIWKAHIDFTKL
jgi:hypothetical protein